jgi:hypothetical protein
MGARSSRGRGGRALATLGVAAAIVAATALGGGVTVAGAAECPNEGLRKQSTVDPATGQGFSVGLPECRAYEVVSPAEKQSHDAGIKGGLLPFYLPGEIAASPAGDALIWTMQASVAEPNNFGEAPSPEQPYLSRRGGSGWRTANALPPVPLVNHPFLSGPFGDFSPDLTSDHVSCGRETGVSSGEKEFHSLTCARRQGENEWEGTPLFTPPDAAVLEPSGTKAYEAGSADLSRVFLQPEVPLLPGDFHATVNGASATAGIYEISHVGPAAQLRLVNVGHEGPKPGLLVRRPEPGATEPPLLGAEAPANEYHQGTQYHAVSQSGQTVFFGATPQDSELESWATATANSKGETEKNVAALYARVPCSAEFSVPCETEAEGHAVEGRQTIKVSDPNDAEGCAACATTTAVPSATTTSGSKIVGVPGFPGVATGMDVSGPGIAEKTTVKEVTGNQITLSQPATASATNVTLTFSTTVERVTTTEGANEVSVESGGFPKVTPGMDVSGPGIAEKTTVTEVTENSLTLSQPAQATATVVPPSEGAKLTFSAAVAGVTTTAAGGQISVAPGSLHGVDTGMAVSGPGVPAGTNIASLSTTAGTLTLSSPATATSEPGGATLTFTPEVAGVETTSGSTTVKVASGGFPGVKAGMAVTGPGIPAKTSVSAVAGEVLTLSTSATASAPAVKLSFKVALANVVFHGASADGSKVFFTTEQKPLVPAGASAATTSNLYEYDFDKPGNEKLVDLTPTSLPEGAGVVGVVRSSSDGTHIYFIAKGVLASEGPEVEPTPGVTEKSGPAKAGERNLYGVDTDTGTIKFIATGLPIVPGAPNGGLHVAEGETTVEQVPYAQTTLDGRDLVFDSTSALAGDTNPPNKLLHPEVVYRYDFDSGELTWISQASQELKAESGSPNPNEGLSSWVAQNPTPASTRGALADVDDYSRAITGEAGGEHDGEDILFTTQERLAPRDEAVGKQAQLYLWHCTLPCPHAEKEGSVRMISDGLSGVEPDLGESAVVSPGERPTTAISASGSDIFFSSRTALVGQDGDELVDLYDARIDGGDPAPAVERPCAGEASCLPPRSPSALGSFGTSTSSLLAAGGNLAPPTGGLLAFHTVKPKPKPLTRAQQLAKALKTCKTKPRGRRAACNAQARKKYGTKAKKTSRRAK